ncbi:hypothetical protein TSAR_014161 [Trichomalopsis sarcophagae]|uniref:F-box domain-containing protein n=1 Tax=Trichomalopsis sarcophagae TaxID=543379 RepID=A0A232EDD7_9HYME|nr:hypothetical protein TSAR_014161 [Trichomalopsis sarcophagae]
MIYDARVYLAQLVMEKTRVQIKMETRQKKLNKSCDKIVRNRNSKNQIAIHNLNDDCLTHIFQCLSIIDRVKIEIVCKHWRDVGRKSWQNVKTLDKNVTIWGFDITRTEPSWMNDIFKTVLQRCGFYLRRDFCPNLEFIQMGSVNLTPMSVMSWTKNVHKLTENAFDNCTECCNDTLLSKLFMQSKRLQSLKIMHNNVLTGKCLLSLPVSMKAIVIDSCPNISFNQLNNVLERHCDQLEKLSLTKSCHVHFPTDANATLKMPTTLKIVEIRWCKVFNIDCILEMRNLEKLVLNGLDFLTDDFLVTLTSNCKMLYHLNIDACNNITNVGLREVVRLPRIEYLSLKRLSSITDSALTHIPNLKKLFCTCCINVADDGICTLIETCDSIEVLDVSYCCNITNRLVECAVNATRYRTNNVVLNLYLNGTSVMPYEFFTDYELLHLSLPNSYNDDLADEFKDDLMSGDNEYREMIMAWRAVFPDEQINLIDFQ